MSFSQQTGVNFRDDMSLADALVLAKNENKIIFIDCYTSWCSPCKKISKDVFPLKEVGDYFNTHFICLSFDMEKGEGLSIKDKFNIQAYPTFLYIQPNGKIAHKVVGPGTTKEKVISTAVEALDNSNNYASLLKKIESEEYTLTDLKKFLDTRPKENLSASLMESYFYSLDDITRCNKEYWRFINQYVNNIESILFEDFYSNRDFYINCFGKQHVERKIINLFRINIAKYGKQSDQSIRAQEIDSALFHHASLLQNYYLSIEMFQNENSRKNWDLMLSDGEKYFVLERVTFGEFNWFSWYIFSNYKIFNDAESLKLAYNLANKALELAPDVHYVNDTYAHILFDLGFITEAIKYERRAIELAKKEESDNIHQYKQSLDNFLGKM